MVLPAIALAWFVGIAAAAFSGAEPAAAFAASGAVSLLAFMLRPTMRAAGLAVLVFPVVALAFIHYNASTPDPAAGAGWMNGTGTVRLRGTIDDIPRERPTSKLYEFAVTQRLDDGVWRAQEGRVLVRMPLYDVAEYGDLAEIEGKLEAPPADADFDYAGYLLRREITSVAQYPEMRVIEEDYTDGVRDRLVRLRESVDDALERALPEPHASFASGTLLGTGSSVPPELHEDMAATGTSHLVAVSGQNIGMLAALVIAALGWLIGRRRAAVLALLAICAYAAVVGGEASVLRATIMGSLYVGAILAGREHAAPIALVYAGAVMTALDPHAVHDVSFQLSFAATLGLMVMAPPLGNFLESQTRGVSDLPLWRPALDLFAVTLAAIVFTLPISAINFGTVSLVAPLANLLVVPAFAALAMTSALVATVVMVAPGTASYTGWLAWPVAAYMLAAIEFCASWPGAYVSIGRITVIHAVAWYAIAGLVCWHLSRLEPIVDAAPPRLAGRLAPMAGLAAAIITLALGGWMIFREPAGEGRVTVTALDVGQGDAILITDRSGQRVLVDGGPSGEGLRNALGRHLPFPDRQIDVVVLTHHQGDHYAGLLDLLDNYEVGLVVAARVEEGADGAERWQSALDASGIPVETPLPGSAIRLDGALMRILQADSSAAELNERSVVLRLDAGESSFLLTGDLGESGEEELMASGAALSADVLKVGHHGSRFSSTDAFLSRVRPAVGVISAGAGNSYGHPSPEVLARLDDSLVLRTDEHGDVSISTDGRRWWVEEQR
jgi:competence protein ComEC